MRWPRTADAILAVIMFLMSLFLSSENPDQDLSVRALSELSITDFILILIANGALYCRRQRPLLVLALSLGVLVVSTGLGYSYDYFGLPIAIYSIGRYVTNDRYSDAGLIVSITVVAISEYAVDGPVEDIGGAFFILFLLWFIGRRIRIRSEYLVFLQERTAQLEREQESEVRQAVVEERTRIACELHDVVAHQVSLMTVQAGAAKTVLVDNPEAARRSMAAVEQAGRQALVELRHLMGVLRPETNADELSPQPGVTDIKRLIENLGEAGLDISFTMDKVPDNLSARLNLSIYRIVQEALTNVLKHSGAKTKTEVRLTTNQRVITIEVVDNGRGATVLPGSGHGIPGMRERAQLLAGRFDAGPRPGGGFQVVAHLPIQEKSK